MLNKIRECLFGKRYTQQYHLLLKAEAQRDLLASLLCEVKAERDDLKMELQEVYTYAGELKEQLEGKGE